MSHGCIMFNRQSFSQIQHYLLTVPITCILLFCPYLTVSYDTPTAREGAAQQDSSGAAAAQEVGTTGKLAGEGPRLGSIPRNPQVRPLWLSSWGKEGLSGIHRKKTVESTPPESWSCQKGVRRGKATTRSETVDLFGEKGKANRQLVGMGGSNS